MSDRETDVHVTQADGTALFSKPKGEGWVVILEKALAKYLVRGTVTIWGGAGRSSFTCIANLIRCSANLLIRDSSLACSSCRVTSFL